MFYNSTAIDTIEKRVGWASAVPPSTLTVVGSNAGTSGKVFTAYHPAATVENVNATVTNANSVSIDNNTLNNALGKMRQQATLRVLSAVFDLNPLANSQTNYTGLDTDLSGTDYSDVIIARQNLFDNAIGFQVALDVLELMAVSGRSNSLERNGKSVMDARAEIYGVFTEQGAQVYPGIVTELKKSIQTIIDILFPKKLRTPYLVDRSNMW